MDLLVFLTGAWVIQRTKAHPSIEEDSQSFLAKSLPSLSCFMLYKLVEQPWNFSSNFTGLPSLLVL